jgi:hypothetical protein
VLGFAIAFLAFAFGGALGLPESVRLLVIGVGVLLAVLSAAGSSRDEGHVYEPRDISMDQRERMTTDR